jgi:hypothetical protein
MLLARWRSLAAAEAVYSGELVVGPPSRPTNPALGVLVWLDRSVLLARLPGFACGYAGPRRDCRTVSRSQLLIERQRLVIIIECSADIR